LGKPLTSRGKRDIKSLATKKYGIRTKLARDLMRGWKEDGVIERVRVTKGEKKPSGLGLTAKGKKQLNSNGPEVTRTDPKQGVMDPKTPLTPPANASLGEARHLPRI